MSAALISTVAVVLLACKPDMDPAVTEGLNARADAECKCLDEIDDSDCLTLAAKAHPNPQLEDGFAEKHSKQTVAQYDAAIE
ncbi:hypothetical protein [Enhygromyxa salina]|nr:hypothetical protein [Enhygromyxa salina]